MKTRWFLLLLGWTAFAGADEVFSVALPECQARLEQRASEPTLLAVKSDCELSVTSLVTLLNDGLPVFLSVDSAAIGAISLGRLINYPQWSRALARAAAEAPAWNSRRGRPTKQQNANRIVTDLLNQSAYLDDLRAVFSHYGFNACVTGVEKVLVFKAKTIFQSDLPNSIKSAEALLPSDAQVWLTLLPADYETRGSGSKPECRLSGLHSTP
jgi:hypothetical protein